MKVNQCDLNCPRKAFMDAEYRENAGDAGLMGVAVAAGMLGIRGVGQAARAATCPQRNELTEPWEPNPDCADAVRNAIAERPLDQAALTDHERRVLEPYIDQNPPAAGG